MTCQQCQKPGLTSEEVYICWCEQEFCRECLAKHTDGCLSYKNPANAPIPLKTLPKKVGEQVRKPIKGWGQVRDIMKDLK
jgi:hypothetical protein